MNLVTRMEGELQAFPFDQQMIDFLKRFKGELPEGRHLRVDNKNFYFDIGQNNRGIYMRMSEVSGSWR